ncbi:MAG: NADPH-dependent F420 reductase, partial [Acidimicrobiia bacterium]|nr:NADPH-dependent F420 reductase [Acidimicrobiia bacterium]
TAVLLQLNVRYRTRVAPKLTGIKRDPREPPPRATEPAPDPA